MNLKSDSLSGKKLRKQRGKVSLLARGAIGNTQQEAPGSGGNSMGKSQDEKGHPEQQDTEGKGGVELNNPGELF